MSMIPAARPRLSEAQVRDRLRRANITDAVAVLASRGYYAQTMGPTPGNDRGIYDDAMWIVSPAGVVAFNANTDPSVHRQGIAKLVPGVHRYRPGRHGISRDRPGKIVSYPAFRPATRGEQLPVTRDGVVNPRPGIAINIHRGSRTSTSSEGCLTIPPDQWPAFQALLMEQLKRHNQRDFPLVLLEG